MDLGRRRIRPHNELAALNEILVWLVPALLHILMCKRAARFAELRELSAFVWTNAQTLLMVVWVLSVALTGAVVGTFNDYPVAMTGAIVIANACIWLVLLGCIRSFEWAHCQEDMQPRDDGRWPF